MKEIEKDQYKKIPLEILKEVTSFCESHQFRYSLAFGTLIGAIRHDGYIPWDDDIDIMMPRKDYEAFLSTFKSEYYSIADFKCDKNYPFPFVKIYDNRTVIKLTSRNILRNFGLFIDVFPLDYVPEDTKRREKLFKKLRRLGMYRFYRDINYDFFLHSKHGFLKTIVLFIIKVLPFTMHRAICKIDKYAKSCPPSNLYGFSTCAEYYNYNTVPVMAVTDFDELIYHRFEDAYFKIIKNYDENLRLCYGDYMTPPCESKQVSPHDLKCYYK